MAQSDWELEATLVQGLFTEEWAELGSVIRNKEESQDYVQQGALQHL